MSLFFNPDEKIQFNLPDAAVTYYPYFLDFEEANSLFDLLYKQTDWQEDTICVFGKTYPQPRLTHLFAVNDKPYSYSNITMYPNAFPKCLEKVKKKIELLTQEQFTTCLANLYRNGQDSNGWHADNEKELGVNPIIASLSLGASRVFRLKHRNNSTLKTKIELTHGSLLIMGGKTQHHWLHQLPKTKKVNDPRINLTFRKLI